MTKQIVVVKAEEFGLEENKAKEIEQAFAGKIAEREQFAKQYEEILKLDIDDFETSEKAMSLRKNLVKVRTGIANIHKVQKAFYFAAGKFVDAWKNKETLPVTMMEEKLKEIETYAERKEKERIDKQQAERMKKLAPFVADDYDLNPLYTDEEFEDLLAIKEKQYNDRVAAEAEEKRKQEEQEKKEKLYIQRREEMAGFGNPAYLQSLTIETTLDEYTHLLQTAKDAKEEAEKIKKLKEARTSFLLPYGQFIPEQHPPFETLSDDEWEDFTNEIIETKKQNDLHFERYSELSPYQAYSTNIIDWNLCEFGSLSDDDYKSLKEKLISAKEAEDKKQAEIKAENERIKKDQEEKQAKAKEEEKKAEKLQKELKREREIKAINFLEKLGFESVDSGMSNEEYNHFIGSRHYDDFESDKEFDSFCIEQEKSIQAAKADKEKEAALAKLKAKDKKEAEEKKKKKEEAAKKAEEERLAALAPEKEKIEKWIESIELRELNTEGFSKAGVSAVHIITEKFKGFKKWADTQKQSIK